MEEIVTVDGRQFKLTVDRPLTATEKAQVLTDIRRQTGCGTCGTRAMSGGLMQSMAATCTRTTISSDPASPAVSLAASPNNGTAPYLVKFFKQIGGLNGNAPVLLSTGPGTLTGADTQTVTADGVSTTAVTYKVTDSEIVAAGTAPAAVTNVDGSGIGVLLGAVSTVRFIVHTSDSCPTGALHCLEYCDLAVVCPTPTCNFVVT